MSGLLRFGWKLGNERIEELCLQLGSPHRKYKVLHIAGTKGKGSTTSLSAAILREAGYNVGSYFSPYVYDPCERVQFNGEMISHNDFARIINSMKPVVEALAATDLGQTTEFELKTALGFSYFAEREADWCCIEVGIGGRLDATNIVHPTVTIITNIGLDHTSILGDTYALIAAEKAGIIKCKVPCITAAENRDALEVISQTADHLQSPLIRVQKGDASRPTNDPFTVRWSLDCDDELESHTSSVTIATSERIYRSMPLCMEGAYQRINAACAVAAVERCITEDGKTLSEETVRKALSQANLPGRMETIRIPDGPLVVLDGAHNGMSIKAVLGPVRALLEREHCSRLLIVVGMLIGHDPGEILSLLAPAASFLFCCQPGWRRALPAVELIEIARRYTLQTKSFPSVADAVTAALQEANSEDMVLITGSFYTVGEARQIVVKT